MVQNFKPGDRAKLTRDLLDPAKYHPVNLYKGDEGEITEHPTQKGLLGFKSDRWGDIISFSDLVDGKQQPTIDFCELVQPAATEKDAVEISSIPSSEKELKKLYMEVELSEEARQTLADVDAKLAALRPVRYEIKTIIQDISEDSEADNSLSLLLNDGWEILELSHHVVDELDGETIIREYRRVVTLRRQVEQPSERAQLYGVINLGDKPPSPIYQTATRFDIPADMLSGNWKGYQPTAEQPRQGIMDSFNDLEESIGDWQRGRLDYHSVIDAYKEYEKACEAFGEEPFTLRAIKNDDWVRPAGYPQFAREDGEDG